LQRAVRAIRKIGRVQDGFRQEPAAGSACWSIGDLDYSMKAPNQ
jgi:hypothetical protein